MAEPQQVEDEVQQAKSAEDRKAAAAMSRLDARDDDGSSANVDSEAASKAMKSLGDASATAKADAAKKVKIDAADVALLVRGHRHRDVWSWTCSPSLSPCGVL